jgi:putative copper export protein
VTWTLIRFLHLLAMAFFVGGQLMLVVAVVPAVRGEEDEAAMRRIVRRFGAASGLALGVLVATGAAMASHLDRWHDDTLQLKLALLVLVVVLLGLHAVAPRSRALALTVMLASLGIVWLGVELAH